MRVETLLETLSQMYRDFGYCSYTMSKFEEYELYLRNKDFLVSDRVLTFTDTDGRLMALKPDVTLSIIKNTSDSEFGVRKLHYQEHVYRPGKNDQGFREITQIGLECMGNVDTYCIFEVLLLAVKSLQSISNACVLDISHMGLVSAALDESGLSVVGRQQVLEAIGNKNAHEVRAICDREAVSSTKLVALKNLCGENGFVLSQLEILFGNVPEVEQLRRLLTALEQSGIDCVNVDFSVVNDMNYYNGIVFCGFVQGIPEGVLSGGQYDALMRKMNRKDHAIGFAIYPALLERLLQPRETERISVLYYEPNAPIEEVLRAVEALRQGGVYVSAQPGAAPDGAVGYKLVGNEVKGIG